MALRAADFGLEESFRWDVDRFRGVEFVMHWLGPVHKPRPSRYGGHLFGTKARDGYELRIFDDGDGGRRVTFDIGAVYGTGFGRWSEYVESSTDADEHELGLDPSGDLMLTADGLREIGMARYAVLQEMWPRFVARVNETIVSERIPWAPLGVRKNPRRRRSR